MLDFIVRHQESLLIAIGTASSLLLLIAAAAGSDLPPARRSFRFAETRGARLAVLDQGSYVNSLVSPISTPAHQAGGGKGCIFVFLAIAVWFGFKIVASLRPIPPAIGLKLPQIIRRSPSNDSLIIFLHGWNGGGAETWQRFPTIVQHDKRFIHDDLLIINYPTYFLRRDLNITDLSEFVGKSLESDLHVFERYRTITVIAHSMGGLVAREVAIQHDLRRTKGGFTQLIEIATPHDGANPSRLASALGISTESAADLTHGSRFLAALRTHWGDFAARPPTVCLGSPQDLVVSAESAESDCVDRVTYPQWGHTEMVKPTDAADYRYVVPTRYVK
jgi:pimeloyl-ACP methyl ester carboxylesterase